MVTTVEQRIQRLIEAATAKALTPVTITRCDGSTYVGCQNYQTAEDGDFQVYVTPVEQRTQAMKSHFRVSYYVLTDGRYKRVNRAAFVAAMEAL